MPRLAIGRNEIFEGRTLDRLRYARYNQRAGFDLVIMAVPEFFLLFRQRGEEFCTDNIFDADQPRILVVAVILIRS